MGGSNINFLKVNCTIMAFTLAGYFASISERKPMARGKRL